MSTVVEIPGGQATIRDVSEMSVKQRRMVQKAMMMVTHIYARVPIEVLEEAAKEGEEGEVGRRKVALLMATLPIEEQEADALLGQQDASIVAFLDSWTIDRPLPTKETVADLPADLYDALQNAVAAPAARLALGTVNFDPTPNAEGFENTPFDVSGTSSSDSNTPTAPIPSPMSSLPNDGVPISTESSIG